jgi:2-polyprenyl-3-methyl-5-hydroxy-6-metoxy-1,4-benzoquinol methylase
MKLPPHREDPVWTRIRAHDVVELWDPSISPHVSATYAARMALLRGVIVGAIPSAGRILDVGCAQGTLGLSLAEAGYRVTLLDIRRESIEYARARYERGDVTFFVGPLSADLPPANDYDLALCTEVLEHVSAPGKLIGLLRDKLRPGGSLLVTTPNADYVLNRLPSYGTAAQNAIDGAEPDSMDGDAHRYLYTRAELVALVRGAGFSIERVGFFSPFWLEGHLKTRHLHRLRFSLTHRPLQWHGRAATHPFFARWTRASQWLLAKRLG